MCIACGQGAFCGVVGWSEQLCSSGFRIAVAMAILVKPTVLYILSTTYSFTLGEASARNIELDDVLGHEPWHELWNVFA